MRQPESILQRNGCRAHTLAVSDQHANILLTHKDDDGGEDDTKSLLKLTVHPTHRSVLVPSNEEDEEENDSSSKKVINYLSSMTFHMVSESGAEYSYYDVQRRTGYEWWWSNVWSFLYAGYKNETIFKAEFISPASERQIQRAMPAPKTHIVYETPDMYAAVIKPWIDQIVTSGSLSWIENVISGTKEKERLLLDKPDYILNIDTKWRSHPDPSKTDRSEWYEHAATQDLYCLAIAKDGSLASIRDLRGKQEHLSMLRSILQECPAAIEQIYGVKQDQLRIFVHYQPQFYHFHVHFTRLENEFGCQVERGHLISDILQNLELDADFYLNRTLTYRLRDNDQLYQSMQEYIKKTEGDL